MSFAMTLPGPIRWVLDRLEGAGYEAYVVGGSVPCEGGVRDARMGLEPKDYDVCTSALPEQTLAVFAGCRVVETGLALSLPCEGGTPREGKGVRTCPLQ